MKLPCQNTDFARLLGGLLLCVAACGDTEEIPPTPDVVEAPACVAEVFTFERSEAEAFDFVELCLDAEAASEVTLAVTEPEITCGHAGAFAGCRDGELRCQVPVGRQAIDDAKWDRLCTLSALGYVRTIAGGDASMNPYRMTITLADGTVIEAGRDLSVERDTKFSYGSAHIGTAVAFAVTDTITWPQSVTITLDFGKIVGMPPSFPIQTDGTGEYPFGAAPPAVEVYVELIQYKSLFEGADGHVTLTQWGQNTGDVIAGHYAGRLIQETSLEDKLWIDVEGSFHFVLPIKHAGQPGG